MTAFDRSTRWLAPLDRPVNAVHDAMVQWIPWTWWPASAPRRDRPWTAGQHAAYLGWSVAGYVAGELIHARVPEDLRSSGRRLRGERLASLTAPVTWLVAAGAWDRRAARVRRRRPWRGW